MPQVETEIKERPILFSGAMVKAILDGRKTQTRRVVKPQLADDVCFAGFEGIGFLPVRDDESPFLCPYGKPGDRLWVRETFNVGWLDGGKVLYRADGGSAKEAGYPSEPTYKPSIFMPRWASRITLEIKSVRVERIQDISGHDCIAEGIPVQGGNSSDGEWRLREKYRELWDSINAKRGYGWEKNPWCWAIEFWRA